MVEIPEEGSVVDKLGFLSRVREQSRGNRYGS